MTEKFPRGRDWQAKTPEKMTADMLQELKQNTAESKKVRGSLQALTATLQLLMSELRKAGQAFEGLNIEVKDGPPPGEKEEEEEEEGEEEEGDCPEGECDCEEVEEEEEEEEE